jgi:hypothetical protein
MTRLLKIKKKLDALLRTHNVTWEELSGLYSGKEAKPSEKKEEPKKSK